MGGFSRQRSRTAQQSFNFPGSVFEPVVAGRAREMTAPGAFDERLFGATQAQQDVLDFGKRLMSGEVMRDQAFENTMGRLAASGLATSAPGIGEQFAHDYTQRTKGAEILQQAAQGLAVLKMMPEELRAKIMAMLLGQTWSGSSDTSRQAVSSGYAGIGTK